jgi:Putative prokaryotic signal transducing protein
MAMIDPEQERRRLAEFYSHQMDGELEAVAQQAYELSDLARETLSAEMSRRGLATRLVELPPLAPPPPGLPGDPPNPELPVVAALSFPEADLELRTMVTIRQIRDLPEALLAKGSLESAGIEVVLTDENMVRLDWFWSNLMGGIKLKVSPEDVEVANEILNQPIPDGFDVAGVGEYRQPQCPKCHSLQVTFQELNRPVSYMTVWLHVPIPVYRPAWRCHACDAEWKDDEAEE